QFRSMMLHDDPGLEIEPRVESEVFVRVAGVTVGAAVSATAIRIDTVTKGNIRRRILGHDAFRSVREILDLSLFEPDEIFLVPYEMLEIGLAVHFFEAIGRGEVRDVGH